jgi:hypothetical protein
MAHDAWETEALGQRRVQAILTARLDALLPEPLDAVRAREKARRARVQRALASMADTP